MLTQQHREELLSRAYILSISACAKVNVSLGQWEFDYGIDGSFQEIDENYSQTGIDLDFQIKASVNWKVVKKSMVSYKLKSRAYNKLVARSVPAMLILLALPRNENEWCVLSEESAILRKCCYWTFLKGDSTNSDQTIYFPIDNILTPEIIVVELKKAKEQCLFSRKFKENGI